MKRKRRRAKPAPANSFRGLLQFWQKQGYINPHETDYDCKRCGLNFDYVEASGLSPVWFVAAHLKRCLLVSS